MSWNVCNVVKVLNRKISLQSILLTHNPKALKFKIDLDSSKQMKSLEMRSKKNREIWENRNQELSSRVGKFCKEDVFFMNEYEPIKYKLSDAISIHKDYCLEPSMLNAPYAILKANFVLNMRSKKALKFLTKIAGVIILPHELTFINKRKVIAFCKSTEDIELALVSGAVHAGDESLVKMLEQGLINYEEYDQAVCHIDAVPLISKLVPILRDKMPVRPSPRVGEDIAQMVHSFIHGYEYESRKVDGVPEEAKLSVPLGEVSWPVTSLEDNFLSFLASIIANSSSQTLGDVISQCSLTCPPSDEDLDVDLADHLATLRTPKKPPRQSATKSAQTAAAAVDPDQ